MWCVIAQRELRPRDQVPVVIVELLLWLWWASHLDVFFKLLGLYLLHVCRLISLVALASDPYSLLGEGWLWRLLNFDRVIQMSELLLLVEDDWVQVCTALTLLDCSCVPGLSLLALEVFDHRVRGHILWPRGLLQLDLDLLLRPLRLWLDL